MLEFFGRWCEAKVTVQLHLWKLDFERLFTKFARYFGEIDVLRYFLDFGALSGKLLTTVLEEFVAVLYCRCHKRRDFVYFCSNRWVSNQDCESAEDFFLRVSLPSICFCFVRIGGRVKPIRDPLNNYQFATATAYSGRLGEFESRINTSGVR